MSRQRCHTACEECRRARTRCDGNEPCHSCGERGKICQYDDAGRRVSKAIRRLPASPLASNDAPGQLGESQEQPGDDSCTPAAASQREHSGLYDLDMPMDLDPLSWTWLHENAFLQHDPDLGGFGFTPYQQASGFPPVMPTPGGPVVNQVLCGATEALRDPGETAALSIDTESAEPLSSLLAREVDGLVDSASQPAGEDGLYWEERPRFHEQACRIANMIGTKRLHAGAVDVFGSHLKAYSDNFNRLWPMFTESDSDAPNLHPILYLVQVSIGCMYGTAPEKTFGSSLHRRLRQIMTRSWLDAESLDEDRIWLAHARLLIQVQGLYFGQRQGFSYAQHLGAVLVAQARRLRLFQPLRHLGPDSTADHFDWKQAEIRKRLAFGILRADVFTSVLLNTSPLLSYEEVNITMPCSVDLWHNKDQLPAAALSTMARIEARHRPTHRLSDMIRILLDRTEYLPEVDLGGYELVLFCLQSSVWKFSQDPEIFSRLAGEPWKAVSDSTSAGSHQSLEFQTHSWAADALGRVHRRMPDLTTDRTRIAQSLEAWYNAFTAARQNPDLANHRDTLMSSLLLWHTLNLQLDAPLQWLHDISYGTAGQRPIDDGMIELVRNWASSESALMAAKRSCTICDIIENELRRTPDQRAYFNFLAFTSLHHAVVILWTFTQLGEQLSHERAGNIENDQSAFASKLVERDTSGLLHACAGLFRALSPLGGASFGHAAEQLVRCPFPAFPLR